MRENNINPIDSLFTSVEKENQHQYLFHHQEENIELYKKYLTKGIDTIVQKMEEHRQPFSGVTPKKLQRIFEEIDLDAPLTKVEKVLTELDEVYLKHAVYFHDPAYKAHLNCPIVSPAILAELILSSVNSSLDTWDQSAGGTLIEQKIIEWTNQKVGLGENSDGVFTSGGTQSNLMALLLARDHFSWNRLAHNVRMDGLPSSFSKFRIFTSEKSHFSIQKNAGLIGLGQHSVIAIPCDEAYKMETYLLEKEIKNCLNQGLIPLAVVATAGTTDFGSIDPLHEIAEITRDYGIWFHVDAAYGCGLLLSHKYNHLLDGIENANSVTIDYHKSFFQPVSCGSFLVKDKEHLKYLTYHADYLNAKSQDKEGIPNQVNKSIQTTRRFDALKMWLTLRTMGANVLGDYFDEIIDKTKEVMDLFLKEQFFELLHQPELSTLVFRYTPSFVAQNEWDSLNMYIRKQFLKSGKEIMAGTKVDGKQYLKFTFLNPQLNVQDLSKTIQLINYYGKQYTQQN